MARTSPWPTVLGTAALIALPVLAAAQSGQASTTGSQASQPKAQSDRSYPVGSGAATQHLTEAKQVLDGISRSAVTGPNASKLNKIRREFAALERSYSANPSTTPGASAKKSAAGHWNTQLMALDRDLTALLGPSTENTSASSATGSTSTTESGATGTSGTPAGSPSSSLDPNVRSQLEEFRKHITQFAAAASGTEPSGEMSSSSSSSMGSTSATGSSMGSTSSTGSTTEPTAGSTSSSSTSQSNPTSTSSQTSSATGEATQAQSGQPVGTSGTQVDAAAARQHLTEARQSLADLTALPQAQQLQGDTRTQVSQLISQFNQLITTQDDWRSAYEQVNGTLTSLLNSPSASSSSTSQGAVGTSGSASASGSANVDPAIRAKLEEFRTHLQAFYDAAGGSAASASSSGSMTGSTSSTGSTSTTTSSGAATGSSAGYAGSAAGTTTSGDAESHIAAIEQILDQASGSSSSATGTSGSTTGSTTSSTATGSTSGTGSSASNASGVTLTQEQIDQIRQHLQQLRTSIKK
jgi:hypothetical protein